MVLECSDLSLCLIYQNSEKKVQRNFRKKLHRPNKKIPVFRVTRPS